MLNWIGDLIARLFNKKETLIETTRIVIKDPVLVVPKAKLEIKKVEIESVPVHDVDTVLKVRKLYPKIQEQVFKFSTEAKKLDVFPFSTLRTFEQQQIEYNKGRDAKGKIIDPTKIVTDAKPGYSYHNYGLAIDMVFGGPGKWTWNSKRWAELGILGKKFGFEWGGNWIKPYPIDKPHFQIVFNQSVQALLKLYKANKKLEDVWTFLDCIKK